MSIASCLRRKVKLLNVPVLLHHRREKKNDVFLFYFSVGSTMRRLVG